MANPKTITSLSDLTTDPKNLNRGTERGTGMLERSLSKYGAGRSILTDKNGMILAGNKTAEQAAALGLDIQTVHTVGDKLVVVVRDDLDYDDPRAKELAIADNRVSDLNLDWDPDILRELQEQNEIDLSQFWFEPELDRLLADLNAEPFDPSAEWVGMPEFHQDDQMPVKQVIVNFASESAVEAFARLVEQNVTMTTKSVWYPAVQRVRSVDLGYVAEESDDAA